MQKIDLYQPLISDKPITPPLTIRVGVKSSSGFMSGGVAQTNYKIETYVLLSSLPKELQERVKTAIQALSSGP